MSVLTVALAFAFLLPLSTSAAGRDVQIEILYDNTKTDSRFVEDWGFSALVTIGDVRILFDAGANPEVLLHNMDRLEIDPASITHALISHDHAEHREGIYRLALRNDRMRVFFLDSFSQRTHETAMAVGLSPERVRGPMEIVPGVRTTGPLGNHPPEQALIVDSVEGPVVLVGCCHPGVAKIVESALRQTGAGSIRLLLGGYHMIRSTDEEIRSEIAKLKELHVLGVAPTHCTGEKARRQFRRAWGANCLAAGVGRRIVIE